MEDFSIVSLWVPGRRQDCSWACYGRYNLSRENMPQTADGPAVVSAMKTARIARAAGLSLGAAQEIRLKLRTKVRPRILRATRYRICTSDRTACSERIEMPMLQATKALIASLLFNSGP